MLVGIKFNLMQNMTVNNKFRQLGDLIENRYESKIAHGSMILYFKYV
jgi:hypothetical protein